MRIAQETIEKIRDSADIVEVVSDFLSLKKKGANWWALSPFTDEKTPSFSVSAAKGIFKCFSTGKGGDSISFVMEVGGMNYVEALEYLAKKYGIAIEQGTPEEQEIYFQEQNLKESLLIVLKYAKNHYQYLLQHDSEGKGIGLSYFKERGYNLNTIEKFDLGYSKKDWNNLENAALKEGYKAEFLEKAGLVIQKQDRRYDRFRGRVMFPVHDLSGRVVAFGARTLKKDDKPKYLNSPETEVYHKSRVLYGIYQAKQHIRKQDECLLVEGYTDVISMHQAGVENVVSSSGTSLTEGQIKLIKRFTDNITVLYDGDTAGIKASLRGIDLILEQGMNVKAVNLPEGEDPDSFVKQKGSVAFEEYLKNNGKDFITFRTELFLEDTKNDPIQKAKLIRDIAQTIAKVPDVFKRTLFNKKCSELLGIDEQILVSEVNKTLIQARQKAKKSPKDLPVQNEEVPLPITVSKEVQKEIQTAGSVFEQALMLQEQEVIRLLVKHGHKFLNEEQRVYQYFLDQIEEVELENPTFKVIIDIYKKAIVEGKLIDQKTFLQHKDNNLQQVVSGLLTDRHQISKAWKERFDIIIVDEDDILSETLYQNVIRLKLRLVRTSIQKHSQKMKKEELEINEEIFIIQCMQQLKVVEMQLAKDLGNIYQ